MTTMCAKNLNAILRHWEHLSLLQFKIPNDGEMTILSNDRITQNGALFKKALFFMFNSFYFF